jgi:uncharacterized protein YbjQ (UPF0145 family)
MRHFHSAMQALLVSVLLGCAGNQNVESYPVPETYSQVPVSEVRIYRAVYYDALPPSTPRLARVQNRKALSVAQEEKLLTALRNNAARRGANAIVRVRTDDGTEYLAVRLDSPSSLALADSLERAAAAASSSGTRSWGGSSGSSPGKEVHVRGYCRKDGTCVRPHTRSRPRRR